MPVAPLLTVAEYFAGIGLMRLGLERAGWKTLFANDIDPKKREMYAHHFGASPELTLGDIHQLDPAAIPSTTLATASFPCTDLSLAGARRGLRGRHSSAFWGFVDVLKAMGARRPPLVLLENVPGFLTSREGADFREALLALNRLGYSVDAFMIDAVRFVPQSRQRLFVVGQLGGEGGNVRALDDGKPDELRPAALREFIARNRRVRWQLRELPPLPNHARQLADILEEMPADSGLWWNDRRRDHLFGQMSAKHRSQAEKMIAASQVSYGTVFRRVRAAGAMAELRTDGIAGCLRTPRGGSARQILFAAGRGKFAVRLLTGRECARLMGADGFRLNVRLNQALFGFGDAVCVPVVAWIAGNYLNAAAEG